MNDLSNKSALQNLSEYFEEFKRQPIPISQEIPERVPLELNEWLAELYELDAYYAGIASTLSQGEDPQFKPLDIEAELGNRLKRLKADYPALNELIGECSSYLDKLRRLHYLICECIRLQ